MPPSATGISPVAAGHTPTTSSPLATKDSSNKKSQKPKKPNYNLIHRSPLPVEVYPLPPLIPHNPLSVLAIALSYLVQILNPPTHPTYNGYFSSAASSIHITDETAARKLWEMGFFGKGSLSRSEPTWLARERKRGITAEENTGQRRSERRQFKLDRAKKEQQDVAERLRAEQTANGDASATHTRIDSADIADIGSVIARQADEAKHEILRSLDEAQTVPANSTDQDALPSLPENAASTGSTKPTTERRNGTTPMNGAPPRGAVAKRQISNGGTKAVRFSPTIEAREFDLSSPVVSPLKHPGPSPLTEHVAVPKAEVENQEHLELSLEEAFFLTYGLGVLTVFSDGSDVVLDSVSLLALFRRHSYFPPHNLAIPLEPDDPFMTSYTVYHHFRSLGWVVRSGVKFTVDYLLYNRGPVFSHAEFAVVVIPSFTDPHWSSTASLRAMVRERAESKSWHWLHNINRVQAQVKKSLVLCYVDIPPPLPEGPKEEMKDIGALFGRYKVREVNVRRWTPNRTRD